MIKKCSDVPSFFSLAGSSAVSAASSPISSVSDSSDSSSISFMASSAAVMSSLEGSNVPLMMADLRRSD